MIQLITERGQVTAILYQSEKKKKASYKVTYYRAQTHAAVWRLKKKKTSYLANPFRLNITLLNYVTYIVISIRKKIIHRNQ